MSDNDLELIREYVRERLAAGHNPNAILGDVSDAAEEIVEVWAKENGWGLWGTGDWVEESACSICGSCFPGACGHEFDPKQKVLRGKDAMAKYAEVAAKK